MAGRATRARCRGRPRADAARGSLGEHPRRTRIERRGAHAATLSADRDPDGYCGPAGRIGWAGRRLGISRTRRSSGASGRDGRIRGRTGSLAAPPRVEESADGRRSVVVDLEAQTSPTTGLREVWLLKADASGLVSTGFLEGASGRFTIPANVDLSQYSLVDVSAEPADGDPAHSGDSIVRGQLYAL